MVRRVFAFAAALLLIIPLSRAFASVVISELLWSGTDLSTADEWIELANTSSDAIDLSGWKLTKLSGGSETGMLVVPPESTIGSGGVFLISNFDEARSRLGIRPDIVSTDVSLVNEKLLIRLYDAGGSLVDAVDDGVGAPFAGSNNNPKASMERVDLTGSGQAKENWKTATTSLNFDDGANLFGTPGAQNGSGSSEDTFPPNEATVLAAEFKRGTDDSGSGELTVSWVPSSSLDLTSQLLSYDPPIANGTGMVLPASATGITFTEGFETGTGITFILRSRDDKDNTSSGVSTVSVLFPEVRITEVLANPIGTDDEEWIEVGNLGEEAIDIAGWILDEGNSPDAYTIVPPPGSTLFLQPGEHTSFRKSLTGLPLGNDGEQLTLSRSLTVMDIWTYPETAEEVSYGLAPRSSTGSSEVGRDYYDLGAFLPFCVPTEGQPNAVIPSDPHIIIQSLSAEALTKEDGSIEGMEKVTINLTVEVSTGSLAHAECNWDYGDGFTPDSCNPPSHTFTNSGTEEVTLTYTNFCGERIERNLTVTILSPPPPPPPEPPPTGGGERGTGGSAPGNRTSCTPSNFSGIRVSEVLPNPVGDDREGEWIELENTVEGTVSLCGWALDDREGGSSPHLLDTYTIAPRSFLLLERQKTRIAINNSAESIRLFAPGTTLIEEVSFEESTEGESYALRQDGVYVWTPLLTPGEPNRFREIVRTLEKGTMIISGVLPNPDGKDEGQEWIELHNIADAPLDLTGWQVDDSDGGSKPYRIENVTLRPQERRRFLSQETSIELTNTHDLARLLDPEGNVVSVLSWRDASSGQIYRPVTFGNGTKAIVAQVIDGDTLTVRIASTEEKVRLIGIDAPETVHPFKPLERFGVQARDFLRSLLVGKTVTLLLGEEPRDKYGRLLAYVLLEDGINVNAELVRRGFATAYLRYPFALADLFASYEAEAKRAKWGMWADEEVTDFIAREDEMIRESTASGSVVTLLPVTETGAYELPEKHYVQQVTFSEVMSNPPKEGALNDLGEYLELFNASNVDADLGEWVLDDAVNASAKPYTIPAGTVVPLHRYIVLPSGVTRISLNNEGEELSLTSPDGKVSVTVTYPEMKRGEAFALRSKGWPAGRSPKGEGWCLTSLPTPGESNICRTAAIARSSKQKSGVSGKQNPSSQHAIAEEISIADPLAFLKVRYRSVLPESTSEPQPAPPPLLAALRTQIVDHLSPSPPLRNWAGNARVILYVLAALLLLCALFGVAFTRTKILPPVIV